ncbi:MAG TPA: TonB-dependent receptor [Gammaproteobacteria bacterium]|nr:TonB-dependent receptor [Gammaproteobacteria bacterium]HIM06240.1 TonB-dependent receptor [Gammaproteobacteria bacterium]
MKLSRVCGYTLASSFLLTTQISFGADKDVSFGIEEVVVTARRREESSQSVPIPITAISGDALRDRASFDMRDLERVTPNLAYINSPVAKNSAIVFLRGIGQVNWGPAQDPKVGTYLNGVYLGRPQGGIFDLLDIDRIEVLRGPQGTLFGRNTTAGLIHVITKQPDQEFDFRLKVGAGEDGQQLIAGTVNIPLSETLATRISVQHREQDGFVLNEFNGSKWNDAKSQNARVSLLWTPTDTFDASLNLDAQRVREKPTLASCNFLGPENGATAPGLEGLAWIFGTYDALRDNCRSQGYLRSYEDDPDDNSEIDSFGTALTLNWDIDGIGKLASISSIREMDEINGSWGFISDSAIGNVLEIQQPPGHGNEFSQWSQEFRLSGSSFDDKLDWVAGIYFFSEDARQLFDVPLFRNSVAPDCADVPQFCIDTGAGTLGDIALFVQTFASNTLDYDATNESQAIFAEGTYHLTESLSVTAGIRYTEDDRELSLTQTLIGGALDAGFTCPDGSAPIASKCSRSTGTQSEVTPRVIFSYQWTDDVLLYGGWSKGYSSGGLNQTPRLEDYQPEISKNWELGFKSQFWDGRVQLNMTSFYNTYEQQQQSVGRIIDNQPVVAILNAQEATLFGFETELTLVPAEGWLITGAHGYIHGEYDEFSVLDVSVGPPPLLLETTELRDISDTKVVRGSPYTYSLSVLKDHNFSNGHNVTAQVGWSFRGRRYDDLETPLHSRQRKYGLMDARLTWRFPDNQTEISFWGRNLLDRKYTASRGGGPDTVFQRIYWGPPRIMGLELSYAFDG